MNMEPKSEGLAQMIFLSKWGDFQSPAANFGGKMTWNETYDFRETPGKSKRPKRQKATGPNDGSSDWGGDPPEKWHQNTSA